ncbi:MAG TPA: hypothetical protein VFQ27_05720 [Xanthobacteraceae bacterium]|nr:hypothetical protein [Xanthobacteraceae bacterium]
MTRFILGLALALALLASTGFVASAGAGPGWSSPDECFIDNGYAGYRSCSGGNGA